MNHIIYIVSIQYIKLVILNSWIPQDKEANNPTFTYEFPMTLESENIMMHVADGAHMQRMDLGIVHVPSCTCQLINTTEIYEFICFLSHQQQWSSYHNSPMPSHFKQILHFLNLHLSFSSKLSHKFPRHPTQNHFMSGMLILTTLI